MQLLNIIVNRRKSSPSCSYSLIHPKVIQQPKETEREMDPEIWKLFPTDLLDRVLALLPLSTFLKLRSTCKRFHSLLFSPVFITLHSSSSRPSSFLVLSHPEFYNTIQLYDPEIGSWKNSPLSIVNSSSPLQLLNSSNGLLCFRVSNSSSLVVCNLLTKSSRVIRLPNWSFLSFSFISTPSSYKILLIASNRAFLYDSLSRKWTNHESPTPYLRQEGVFFKGAFFFATLEPVCIVSFVVEAGKWKEHESELPSQLTFARLVTDGEEKLLMVGGIGENGISRSVKVWELSSEGERWNEVETLPDMMCKKLLSMCYHNYSHLFCLWHRGMICLYSYDRAEILYFQVSRKTWHWIPKCPALPLKCSYGFKWFSFSPQIASFA